MDMSGRSLAGNVLAVGAVRIINNKTSIEWKILMNNLNAYSVS